MEQSPTIPALLLLSGAFTFAAGCEASFTDLRPDPTSPLADAGFVDAGFDDAGLPVRIDERLLASGVFEGRDGHAARGGVDLYLAENGAIELRMTPDFYTSRVPGPVVVLSDRADLGTRIEPASGDVELGVLRAPSGAQIYLVPEAARSLRYTFVFCRPFGTEVGRAELLEVP